MHPLAKRRVSGVATQGQMAQQFFLAHDHAGLLRALADQAGQGAVMQ